MYYINSQPNESGNHGNPVSNRTTGMIELPDNLLQSYLDTLGFAIIEVENNIVTSVVINQEAYDAYVTDHPIVPDDPQPTVEDDLMSMAVDHELRISLLELGLNEEG